jgi:CheY-like chemotaxis protein
VWRRDSEIEICVRDTGIGVAPDALPHLFERFWQADRSPGRQHGGLGLGLAIVRHLVELHGGNVQAEGAGEGRGATITVRLPVPPACETDRAGRLEARGEGDTVDARRPLAGVKVLVVDDQADARELLEKILNDAGADTRAAATAADGLQIVHAWRPHVMLSDIGMPGSDGYQLIRAVRALAPADGGLTAAIALTAYGTEQDRARARDAGFDQHLIKPVTPALVTSAVAELAGRAVAPS